MCLRRRGNMISSDTYRRKLVLLGLLLLVGCLPPVRSVQYDILNATSSVLTVNDILLSPSKHFELGIFSYAVDENYYLCIRYFPPIHHVVTFVANRNHPVSSSAVLQFNNGKLELHNPDDNYNQTVWITSIGISAVKASLSDAGNLLLMDGNGTIIWDSFKDDIPTDTLLPGQYMYRNQSHYLTSWQKDGSPAIGNWSYTFGWNENNLNESILTLSWTLPEDYINAGGRNIYIPAPDVQDAHKIVGVDYVYFHETLGHLYIDGTPADTSILSGGSDYVNATTLKRITICNDGGFRIFQWTIGQNSTTWTTKANWVLSERPDTRSQCIAYGTCGPYGWCISEVDMETVECKCPDGFVAKDISDLTKGCTLPISTPPISVSTNCTNNTIYATFTATTDVTSLGMVTLNGVDLPWGGDYMILTGDESANCKEVCMYNCWCAAAVYSKIEQKCWTRTGTLYNIGYPTYDLFGNDRTAFIRTTLVDKFQVPPALPPTYMSPLPSPSAPSPTEPVIIGLAILGGAVVVLVVASLSYLCFKGKLGDTTRCWGPCTARTESPRSNQYSGSESQ